MPAASEAQVQEDIEKAAYSSGILIHETIDLEIQHALDTLSDSVGERISSGLIAMDIPEPENPLNEDGTMKAGYRANPDEGRVTKVDPKHPEWQMLYRKMRANGNYLTEMVFSNGKEALVFVDKRPREASSRDFGFCYVEPGMKVRRYFEAESDGPGSGNPKIFGFVCRAIDTLESYQSDAA